MKLGVRQIDQKRFCTFHSEEWIVLSPDDQCSRLLLTEVLVPFGIERYVRRIVVEQVELDSVIGGAVEKVLIEGVGIRADGLGFLRSVSVLKPRGLGRKQRPNRLFGLGIPVGPEGLQRFERRADALDVRVAVLYDDALDCFGVTCGNAEPDGSAVVLNVDAELTEANHVEEQLFDIFG